MTEADMKAPRLKDAERYGICEYCRQPKRNRQQDCCGNIYVCRDVVNSRLLAVEAELGLAKAEARAMREAGEMLYGQVMLWNGSDEWTEEDSRSALAWREAKAAPPSPPVAPEPAQENQGPSGQKENDNGNRNDRSATTEQREAGDAGLARSEADSTRDDRCPEGGAEVTGEGVGHHQARRSATVGRRSDDGRVAELEAKVTELEQERADLHGALGDMEHAERERLAAKPAQEAGGVERVTPHDIARRTVQGLIDDSHAWSGYTDLLEYIDQQEQSEREAAGLMLTLRVSVLEMTECLPEDVAEATVAELIARAELECDSEYEQRVQAESDRDAERTQKEALRVELDQYANLCDWANAGIESALGRKRLTGPSLSDVVHELFNAHAALRAENEGLLSALHLIAGTHGTEASAPRAHAAATIAQWSRAQQPTEAAPVAKRADEYTLEEWVAKAEAPSEPAVDEPGHWGPVDGDPARCNWVGDNGGRCIHDNAHTCRHRAFEPAPQPPATRREEEDAPPGFREVKVFSDSRGTLSLGLGGFTTVRVCRHCGVLIVGGPTACVHCVAKLEGGKS